MEWKQRKGVVVHGPNPEKALFLKLVATPLGLYFDGTRAFPGHI